MESLEFYMALKYSMQIEPSTEGGYVVTYPDLPGIVAEGDTVEEACANAEDLREDWTALTLENGWEVPMPGELKSCSGTLTVRIPPSLHKRLTLRARSEKISLNRLISYLLATGISNPALLDNLNEAK